MTVRLFITSGGFLAALGVAAGAIGAHLLEEKLDPEQMASYQTAVRYQTIHAVGLVLVGLMAARLPHRALSVAGWAFLTGVALFSGCIYAWLATGVKAWIVPVPFGGVAFILGWLAVAWGGARAGKNVDQG